MTADSDMDDRFAILGDLIKKLLEDVTRVGKTTLQLSADVAGPYGVVAAAKPSAILLMNVMAQHWRVLIARADIPFTQEDRLAVALVCAGYRFVDESSVTGNNVRELQRQFRAIANSDCPIPEEFMP